MWAIYGWLIDALIRLYRDYRTRNWPTATGEVQSCHISGASVVVTFSYTVDKQRLTGIHNRSCLDPEEYAKRFLPDWSVVVRYKGSEPLDSVLIDEDQANPPVWATRYRDADG